MPVCLLLFIINFLRAGIFTFNHLQGFWNNKSSESVHRRQPIADAIATSDLSHFCSFNYSTVYIDCPLSGIHCMPWKCQDQPWSLHVWDYSLVNDIMGLCQYTLKPHHLLFSVQNFPKDLYFAVWNWSLHPRWHHLSQLSPLLRKSNHLYTLGCKTRPRSYSCCCLICTQYVSVGGFSELQGLSRKWNSPIEPNYVLAQSWGWNVWRTPTFNREHHPSVRQQPSPHRAWWAAAVQDSAPTTSLRWTPGCGQREQGRGRYR